MPDPYIICCAAGVCCDDGSPNQQAALAQLYRDEMTKHSNAMSHEVAQAVASITLEHFKLENREPLPPGVVPKSKEKDEAKSRVAEKESSRSARKAHPPREGL
jgi:hypothetical protein